MTDDTKSVDTIEKLERDIKVLNDKFAIVAADISALRSILGHNTIPENKE